MSFKQKWPRLGLALLTGLVMSALTTNTTLANGAELIFGESALLEWTEADLIQNGRTPPTNTHPVTNHEFYTSFLREEAPVPPPSTNRFVFSLHPYYCGFSTPYASPDRYEVIYLNDSIPPLYRIGDRFTLGDHFAADLVMDQTPGIEYMVGDGSYLPWKFNTYGFSGEYPRHGYIALSFSQISFALGRFKTGIGHGQFGNTFLNGRAPYYDHLQATYYNERFKFHYLLGSSHSWLSSQEKAIQQAGGCAQPLKMFAYHRVEYSPADWIKVGFGEMNIIGGKYPDFNQINPVGFWHNTYTPESSNVMVMLDVSAVPIRGIHVYGEFLMDDYRLPTEGESSNPNAFAYQAGFRYVLPLSGAVKHQVGVELAHVDPWTYNRSVPYLTMYQRQVRQGVYLDIPLGYAYGGDLNEYGAYYSAVSLKGLRFRAGYQHLDKGEVPLGLNPDGTPAYDHRHDFNDGPSGIIEHHNSFGVSVEYPLSQGLILSAAGHLSLIRNLNHLEGASGSLSMVYMGIQWHY